LDIIDHCHFLDVQTTERQRLPIVLVIQRMAHSMQSGAFTSTPAERKLSASERLKLLQLLQLSQWSLKHVIQVFDMVEKKEIELVQNIVREEYETVRKEKNETVRKEKIETVWKEKYETVCRQFLPGGLVIHSSALRKRLEDELTRLRKIDQEAVWFKAIEAEGYLRKSSPNVAGATTQPGLVAPVEDQKVLRVGGGKDVPTSEAEAFVLEENKETAVVSQVGGEDGTSIVELGPLPVSELAPKPADVELNELMESVVHIYVAIEKGELKEFQRMMKLLPVRHWSLSPGEYKGATPLHWAALHGQVAMVSFIQREMASFMLEHAPGTSFGKDQPTHESKAADKIRLQIVDARDKYGFTPLHLAVYYTKLVTDLKSIKDSRNMIEDLFKMGATNCATTSASSSVIETDCLSNPLHPIHLAIWFAHPRIVEKLLELWPQDAFVKTKCGDSSLHLAAWCANLDNDGGDVISLLLQYLDHSPNKNAINSLNHDRQSALHIATLNGNVKCVEALLRCEQIKVSQRNWKGYTALEIATVKVEKFKRLSKSSYSVHKGDENDEHKMEDEDYEKCGVTRFVDEYDDRRIAPVIGMKKITVLFDGLDAEALHKERQVYVDAANAILVGAALIASASFGAWLQPPLGYVPYYSSQFLVTDNGAPPETYQSYVAIKQHWIIQLFWIFNSLSFFFSLATVIAGADAAVPRQGLILKDAVKSVRSGVKWASWLLSIAIIFVIGTFTTIGFAILPPIEKYRISMWFFAI
jgi:ankyrin repeat protein